MVETWLVSEPYQKRSPNVYLPGSPKVKPVECIVFHATAGPNAESALSWFEKPASKASAHFVIDRNGTTYQCAPLEQRCWHCRGFNYRSIGIEMAGWCNLKLLDSGVAVSSTGVSIPKDEVLLDEADTPGMRSRLVRERR